MSGARADGTPSGLLIGRDAIGCWPADIDYPLKLPGCEFARDLMERARAYYSAFWELRFVQGCVSFLAGRKPAAAVSLSHMYSPFFVFP
jgi:hypothetical protein